jgi:cysteine desulfurase
VPDKIIYMDHAATTYTKPAVLEAMLPYFSELFGNPSGIYAVSRDAYSAIDHAREQVASVLNAQRANEVYFTGSGTESDNWALKGVAFANTNRGKHIITSKIEHHAILHTCEWLQKQGFDVTYLDVDKEGFVSPESVEQAIRPETILVSVMFANNEIGTIEPIAQIGEICRDKRVLFHTDAVQAFGSVPIDVQEMKIDLLSLTAHKLYGPKGTGALYIRNGVRCEPLLHGGAQERGRRASTENVAGIVGLGAAAEIAAEQITGNAKRLSALRDRLIDGILAKIPFARLNGPRENRLPNNVNVCFEYIEGEGVLLLLDRAGIEASSGSACTSGSLDPSHVLLAIGMPSEIAHGSLRLTLGERTTPEDIDTVLLTLPPIIQRLRDMSPLFDQRKETTYVQR